eukprot:9816052-Karenia_brevis.AAC.1
MVSQPDRHGNHCEDRLVGAGAKQHAADATLIARSVQYMMIEIVEARSRACREREQSADSDSVVSVDSSSRESET